MPQNDQSRLLKALDYATDFSKQQTAFAALLVSLSVALHGNLIPSSDSESYERLAGAWLTLLVSMLCGLLLLGRAAGKLIDTQKVVHDIIFRLLGLGQIILLILGLILFACAIGPHIGREQTFSPI